MEILLANFTEISPNWAEVIQLVFSLFVVIITGIGTYYVAKSFQAQHKINSQQLLLNKYLIESHRRKIRPIFQLNTTTDGWDNIMLFELSLVNAIAINIVFTDKDRACNYFRTHDNLFDIFEPGNLPFNITLNEAELNLYSNVPGMPATDIEMFEIKFEDEDTRVYQQHLYYNTNSTDFWLSFPQLTNK